MVAERAGPNRKGVARGVRGVIEPREALAAMLRSAAQATLRGIGSRTGLERLAEREGEQYDPGDPGFNADEDAHRVFEEAVRESPYFGALHVQEVLGQEKLMDPPSLVAGQRLIIVDPIDGTWPWLILHEGYCVAAIALLWDSDNRPQVDCAIIATRVDCFTLLGYDDLRYGRTFADSSKDLAIASTVPENRQLPPSIAAVAYKPSAWLLPHSESRDMFLRILDNLGPAWAAFTIGGNPITPYVIVGGLTAAISLNRQTSWDALAVLMATATDAVVGHAEGTLVFGPTFSQLFANVMFSGEGALPIPRMIVAKTHERFMEVVHAAEDL